MIDTDFEQTGLLFQAFMKTPLINFLTPLPTAVKSTSAMEENLMQVGDIGNYYGNLYITTYQGRYYWIIENYDTSFSRVDAYEEISKEIYDALLPISKKPEPLVQF